MGSFNDFIRYGLPGYLLLLTVLLLCLCLGLISNDPETYKDYVGILVAMLLIIGPLIGFLIHQIYFVYFDWRESYTKPSRGCIGLMIQLFMDANPQEKINKSVLQKYSFLTWKFLTTNYEDSFKVDDLFIKRLRSLRNYSHSFGSIIATNIFCLFLCFISLCLAKNNIGEIFIVAIFHILIFLLFFSKRQEIKRRLDELEITMIALDPDLFVTYMSKLIKIGKKYNNFYKVV